MWVRIQPVLHQLHWLPIEYQTLLKVTVLTFKALDGLGPAYLLDSLSPYVPCRALCLSDQYLPVEHALN